MNYAFEKLAKESDKAFAAFRAYLDLGPQRSLAAVATKLGKSTTLIERWSRRHQWCARVEAHAAHLASAEREATTALVQAKSAEWLARQQGLREREWALHEQCLAAAERALAAFMTREKVYANLADIARILEVASKLGRLSSGLATETVEHSGEVDVNFRLDVEAAIQKVYGPVIDVAPIQKGEGA